MQFILAPLQGYTEIEFRNAWASVFTGFDYAISPFIPLAEGSRFRMTHLRDVLPANNSSLAVVPQVLGNDVEKFVLLSHRLLDLGYDEINWNLGCPKRTVATKKRGSGLLPYPDQVRQILEKLVAQLPIKLSIKTRLGYHNPEEFYDLMKVYNDFPLKSLIIHPRTGIQEYEGEMHLKLLRDAISAIKHEIVFSGDIMDKASFQNLAELFPEITRWMIGRGVLANPFLPEMLCGCHYVNKEEEMRRKLVLFHERLYHEIFNRIGKEKATLNKMKDFWSYFALWFGNSYSIFHTLAHFNHLEEFMQMAGRTLDSADFSPFGGRTNRQLKTTACGS